MKQYIKDNNVKFGNEIIIFSNGVQIINPAEDTILANGWQEYIPPVTMAYTPTYEERVEQLIRERYSVSDEFAILRQRDTKEDEFNEYFAFCEECKTIAKNEIK